MKKYLISGFADEIAQDLTTQLINLKKLDMHYVEMRGVDGNNLIFHTPQKVKEIKERLDEAGVALSALGSPLGKIGIDDPFEKHFEEFKTAVEIAHKMETPNIRMFSFYVPEGKSKEYKGKVFDRLGQFADYAKENHVVLLHENEKGIYGEKAAQCKEIMDAFRGAHFKAIFDFVAHFINNFFNATSNNKIIINFCNITFGSGEVIIDYLTHCPWSMNMLDSDNKPINKICFVAVERNYC